MSFRKVAFTLAQGFICWFLWSALQADSINASAGFWPAFVALILIFLIPTERLEGKMFVDIIKAIKDKD